MASTRRSIDVCASALLTLWLVSAQVAKPQDSRQSPHPAQRNSTAGTQTFSSTCAGCHGLDGRGGERAPNIVDRPNVQRLSDAQIFHIIENGVPGTGMPAFHSLESSQIKSIVAYLRTLQGAKGGIKLPGDAAQGKMIFFGKAECSKCHMVAGEGGFIASDLSQYARVHAVEEIRSAITDPSATNSGHMALVTVMMRGGEKYVGRIRNEDNFSLQLQGLDGTFYFVSKPEIEKLEYASQTFMPSNYGSTLSAKELNDVVSYLMSAAGAGAADSPKNPDEWEQ
jgi:cytochrome c oxidase cbb3-type subunit III